MARRPSREIRFEVVAQARLELVDFNSAYKRMVPESNGRSDVGTSQERSAAIAERWQAIRRKQLELKEQYGLNDYENTELSKTFARRDF